MPESWTSTQQAANSLGMAEQTLRKWIHKEDTPFVAGVHYLPKTSSTAPYRWNVTKIRELFIQVGSKVVAAEDLIRKIKRAKTVGDACESGLQLLK